MKIDIGVKVTGDKKAIARMLAMYARTQAFNTVLLKAKQQLKAANAANFTSNGLPVGGWSPLSPTYAAWKATRFPGAPPMVRTGKLFASLSGATQSFEIMTNKSFSVGTSVEYAKFHQYGTTKMPKRKIVFEPPLFAKKLAADAADWVANGEAL